MRSQLPLDQVVDQDPDPGEEADEGSTVVLEVSGGPGTVRVPSVQGLPRRQAIDRSRTAACAPSSSAGPRTTSRRGSRSARCRRPGEPVERGERVRVFVSSGPEQVEVPDVTGLSRDSAEDAPARRGARRRPVSEQESEEPEGEVISQDPAGGTQVDRGTAVTSPSPPASRRSTCRTWWA